MNLGSLRALFFQTQQIQTGTDPRSGVLLGLFSALGAHFGMAPNITFGAVLEPISKKWPNFTYSGGGYQAFEKWEFVLALQNCRRYERIKHANAFVVLLVFYNGQQIQWRCEKLQGSQPKIV